MKLNKNVKMFMSYVIPSIIAMLIVGSYSIVDSVFIGQYSGKTGLAAVAITWPLIMFFGAVGDMVGTGAGVLIAQAQGANNIKKARSSFANMMFLQVLFCIILIIPCTVFLPNILILSGANIELLPISLMYAKILIYGCFASMLTTGLISVIRNDGLRLLR